jgi:hypothetical protein
VVAKRALLTKDRGGTHLLAGRRSIKRSAPSRAVVELVVLLSRPVLRYYDAAECGQVRVTDTEVSRPAFEHATSVRGMSEMRVTSCEDGPPVAPDETRR